MNLGQDGAVHVVEGPEQGDEAIPEGQFEVPGDVARVKFKKFVKEFAYVSPGSGNLSVGTLKYREQFMQNISSGFNYLEVSLSDITAHNDFSMVGHCLRTRPTTYVPLCEKALQELYTELVKREDDELSEHPPHIQLHLAVEADLEGSFGTMKPMLIRDLTSTQVERLVVVQGIVSSMKTIRAKARKIYLKCINCENVREIHVGPGLCSAHIPSACEGSSLGAAPLTEKCGPSPFRVQDSLCEYVDEQQLKLQELPEHVPVGEMPRSFDLVVQQYTVGLCVPGMRLTAVGIFCATERAVGEKLAVKGQRGTNTVKYSYIQVLGVQPAQGAGGLGHDAMRNSTEDEERFEMLARDPEIRDKIVRSIAPSIRASAKDVIDEVKKAVASLLFGGSRKQLDDGTRMRGDINILLMGDPGVAKSQFLKFSEKAAPIAVYTSGKGSSAAGLTASIRNERGSGFTLEGGAMVLADGGVVCIDEFDKMDVKDRVAIHEAMEQQTISIAKAGITTMLNTRCSVLAAANPRFGTLDDLMSTVDQMDFETTILSRFDMMFLVKDVRDPERDYHLAKHLVSLHSGQVEEESQGPLGVAELRKYISYCRSRCSPRLTKEAAEVLKNHYVSIRKAMKQENTGIPITVRQLEAIVRISESLAKMELVEDVNIGHVEEALRMFTVSTLDSANKDRGVGIDHLSEQEREELQKAEEQVRKIVPRGGRRTKMTLHQMLVSTAGIDERIASRAIYNLQMRGELVEKTGGTLQREN
mmetsp:Transcript_111376/g.314445  ORF Transcript_111376/g.314445 Transcript_111376/m.314445 type:complete len:756 (-) Transcript_111376:124-2391(-)